MYEIRKTDGNLHAEDLAFLISPTAKKIVLLILRHIQNN